MKTTRNAPVLLLAVLALVVSLAGTSAAGYAVGRAHGKVSGNHLIKKHSLSGNRIKPDSMTGTQIAESTLGTVPHAAVADSLPTPSLLPLTALGVWTVGTDRAVGARKDASGFVHLEGDIGLHVFSASAVMTVLPPGYRPAGSSNFAVATGNGGATPGVVRVTSDGDVIFVSGTDSYTALDSVEFLAAN